MVDDQAAGQRVQLVRRLAREGALPAEWVPDLTAVPREVFVPDTVWHPTSRGYLPLCRSDDPRAWLRLAYRDDRVVAQVDDGAPSGAGRYPTSSVLAPSEVGLILSTVDAKPGMRVCVVGAGLGYLTAVLASRLGASPGSAPPTTTKPCSASTCATADAPTGGWSARSAASGPEASGYDRSLPSPRWTPPQPPSPAPAWTVQDVAGGFDVSFAIGARVPDCASVFVAPDDQWFTDPATGSWARWHRRPFGPHRINQYGPRALWDEIESAYHRWRTTGRPRAGDWRITATRDHTTIDLPPPAAAATG